MNVTSTGETLPPIDLLQPIGLIPKGEEGAHRIPPKHAETVSLFCEATDALFEHHGAESFVHPFPGKSILLTTEKEPRTNDYMIVRSMLARPKGQRFHSIALSIIEVFEDRQDADTENATTGNLYGERHFYRHATPHSKREGSPSHVRILTDDEYAQLKAVGQHISRFLTRIEQIRQVR